jgi:hypothetical protein
VHVVTVGVPEPTVTVCVAGLAMVVTQELGATTVGVPAHPNAARATMPIELRNFFIQTGGLVQYPGMFESFRRYEDEARVPSKELKT